MAMAGMCTMRAGTAAGEMDEGAGAGAGATVRAGAAGAGAGAATTAGAGIDMVGSEMAASAASSSMSVSVLMGVDGTCTPLAAVDVLSDAVAAGTLSQSMESRASSESGTAAAGAGVAAGVGALACACVVVTGTAADDDTSLEAVTFGVSVSRGLLGTNGCVPAAAGFFPGFAAVAVAGCCCCRFLSSSANFRLVASISLSNVTAVSSCLRRTWEPERGANATGAGAGAGARATAGVGAAGDVRVDVTDRGRTTTAGRAEVPAE